MSVIDAVRDAWALLDELDPHDLRVRVIQRRDGSGPAVLVGVDPIGCRHLLIEVPDSVATIEDRGSSGVQILRRTLLDGPRERAYVDVACTKPHLSELFDIVAAEMIDEVRSDHPGRPDLGCRAVLERWRDLLDRQAGTAAGPERLAGLFAELTHLIEIARIAPATALGRWTGPRGGRHDFMGAAASMEVKASLAHHGRFIEVHSAEQLQPPVDARLFLAFMRLEPSASGACVGELVRAASDLGLDRHELETLVARAGFRPVDLALEGAPRFDVLESLVYRVDSAFPRIIPDSFVGGRVPPGVMRVRYLADLSSEPPFPLSAEETAQLHQILAR